MFWLFPLVGSNVVGHVARALPASSVPAPASDSAAVTLF